jgi:hypothetical protein
MNATVVPGRHNTDCTKPRVSWGSLSLRYRASGVSGVALRDPNATGPQGEYSPLSLLAALPAPANRFGHRTNIPSYPRAETVATDPEAAGTPGREQGRDRQSQQYSQSHGILRNRRDRRTTGGLSRLCAAGVRKDHSCAEMPFTFGDPCRSRPAGATGAFVRRKRTARLLWGRQDGRMERPLRPTRHQRGGRPARREQKRAGPYSIYGPALLPGGLLLFLSCGRLTGNAGYISRKFPVKERLADLSQVTGNFRDIYPIAVLEQPSSS